MQASTEMANVGFLLSAEEKHALFQMAREQDRTPSQLLRQLVRGYIAGHDRDSSTDPTPRPATQT
jgi:hypothetical protein